MPDGIEQGYRDAVQRWAAGDLDGAARGLSVALESSAGPDDDPWWFAASRLADMPIGAAQTLVLRARVAAVREDVRRAELDLSHAVTLVQLDRERDIGSLMNGAIALVAAAEVLVDLGYGTEALRLIDRARERSASRVSTSRSAPCSTSDLTSGSSTARAPMATGGNCSSTATTRTRCGSPCSRSSRRTSRGPVATWSSTRSAARCASCH